MCTQTQNTHRDVVGLPADGTHARTARQAEGRRGALQREKAAKASSLPSVPATYRSYNRGRERTRNTAETLHVATAISATEQKRKRRGGET